MAFLALTCFPFRHLAAQSKYEKACDLYFKAAAQYKISKMWQEAGDTYVKAAELFVSKVKSRLVLTSLIKCFLIDFERIWRCSEASPCWRCSR